MDITKEMIDGVKDHLLRTGYFINEYDNLQVEAEKICKIVAGIINRKKTTKQAETHDNKMRSIFYDTNLIARISEYNFDGMENSSVIKELAYDTGLGAAQGFASPEIMKLSYNMKWAGYKRKQAKINAKMVRIWKKI